MAPYPDHSGHIGSARQTLTVGSAKAPAVLKASLPKDPDRSHLADAIHFMDLIDSADEELPRRQSSRRAIQSSSRHGTDGFGQASGMAGPAPGTLRRSGERM